MEVKKCGSVVNATSGRQENGENAKATDEQKHFFFIVEEETVQNEQEKNDSYETELNDFGAGMCATPGIEENGETPKSTNNTDKNNVADNGRKNSSK